MTAEEGVRVVVVTGLSGAGKSTALNSLEDLGYFCVDNLPTALLERAVEVCEAGDIHRIALGIDVRVGSFWKVQRQRCRGSRRAIATWPCFFSMPPTRQSSGATVRVDGRTHLRAARGRACEPTSAPWPCSMASDSSVSGWPRSAHAPPWSSTRRSCRYTTFDVR